MIDVQNISSEVLSQYDNLLLGTSTWGAGELQDDWFNGVDVVRKSNLSGKTVALFGCGDSESYCDTFCGALAELKKAAVEAGATVVGAVSTEGYNFQESDAVENGSFVGLALDEINEDSLTDVRIDAWLEDVKPSLG